MPPRGPRRSLNLSDWHPPAQEENDGEVSEAGEEGVLGCSECGQGVRDALNGFINHCNLTRDFEAKEDK